jgi:Ca2+-binding EF-hand superfamily protein
MSVFKGVIYHTESPIGKYYIAHPIKKDVNEMDSELQITKEEKKYFHDFFKMYFDGKVQLTKEDIVPALRAIGFTDEFVNYAMQLFWNSKTIEEENFFTKFFLILLQDFVPMNVLEAESK